MIANEEVCEKKGRKGESNAASNRNWTHQNCVNAKNKKLNCSGGWVCCFSQLPSVDNIVAIQSDCCDTVPLGSVNVAHQMTKSSPIGGSYIRLSENPAMSDIFLSLTANCKSVVCNM